MKSKNLIKMRKILTKTKRSRAGITLIALVITRDTLREQRQAFEYNCVFKVDSLSVSILLQTSFLI